MFIYFSLQREINEVLEQRKSNGAAAPQSLYAKNDIVRSKIVERNQMNHLSGRMAESQNGIDFTNHDSLRDSHCRLNAKIIRNATSLNGSIAASNHHGSSIRKTNEWADSILKDLDNLILSNQRYTASCLSNSITASNASNAAVATGPPKSPQKRSTIINVVLRKTTPSTSPTSPTAPTEFPSTPAHLNKNQTAIITAPAQDNNKIPKPEKHVSGFGFSFLSFFYFCFLSLSFRILCLLIMKKTNSLFFCDRSVVISSFVLRHLCAKSL